MKRSIASMLKEVSEEKSRDGKIVALRNFDSPSMRLILKYTFDPKIEWLLPEGKPPYRPVHDDADVEGRLYYEARKLYLYVKGGNDNLQPKKREQLFIQTLESVDPDDAELLCSIKDKKIPYKGITKKLVQEAFPELL